MKSTLNPLEKAFAVMAILTFLFTAACRKSHAQVIPNGSRMEETDSYQGSSQWSRRHVQPDSSYGPIRGSQIPARKRYTSSEVNFGSTYHASKTSQGFSSAYKRQNFWTGQQELVTVQGGSASTNVIKRTQVGVPSWGELNSGRDARGQTHIRAGTVSGYIPIQPILTAPLRGLPGLQKK